MMAFALVFGFLLGAVAVLALEGILLYWLLQTLARKKASLQDRADARLAAGEQARSHPYEMQGVVWVLDQDKIPKTLSDPQIKETKELKNKKEIIEISPVKKNAKIKDHCLILSDHDGIQSSIPLLGCSVLAVSSSNLSSRKWYKRYPIRIESKDKLIYNERKTCYLYLETSSEKESWCRALRLASTSDKNKIASNDEVKNGFNSYLMSLSVEYPLFQKPSRTLAEFSDKNVTVGEPSSRVRHFFKKIVRKTARIGSDYKSNTESLSTRGDKKNDDRLRNSQNALSASGSTRSSSSEKSSVWDMIPPTSPKDFQSVNPHIPLLDSSLDESGTPDEGALCLNMLLARLFFDAKRSKEINNLITSHLQRTLSNMRTPSYIGGITCTGLDVGTLPPYIHHMRTLPVDMKEMCALEVDIEYNGGFLIEIETRLDIREPEFQEIVDTDLDQNTAEDVTSELLEDFESYNNQLKFTSSASVKYDKQDGSKPEGLRASKSGSWASTYKARWKTIVNSIVDHVSQVPISLAIKVESLRGTLCLRIKPPPSDQIWYGFTSMPEIDFTLDSSFGDHKISSAHVGLIITNRLKVAIRESIVLPNCESICIPWMSAEKDDWLPRSDAPYIWLRQENSELPRKLSSNSQPHVDFTVKPEKQTKSDDCRGKASNSSEVLNDGEKGYSSDHIPPFGRDLASSSTKCEAGSTSFSSDDSCLGNTIEDLKTPLEDLKMPLLENSDGQTSRSRLPGLSETLSISNSDATILPTPPTQDDPTLKKSSRRARMFDLGKKMGEKIDEKRRHIGEKGRHMVEKLRESSKGTSEVGSFSGSFSNSFKSNLSIPRAE